MDKNKAIPKGYMTVGEVAKKMDVTVRTLQYYDKEGILSPSSESEGGRRLYSDKDVINLYQILSMKHLGFSLDDIKNRLISLDTPDEIAHALSDQATCIRQKIEALSESLQQIEALKEEVLQMQMVDFKKYSDIIVNLQMKNEFYWLIKHMDDDLLDNFRSRFDMSSGLELMETYKQLNDTAIKLLDKGVKPDSEEGFKFAEAYWNMIMKFTGGDLSMLPKLIEMGTKQITDNKMKQTQENINAFVEPALEAYFDKLNYNPLEDNMDIGGTK